MISTATLRYVRISPRKVRPVIALVKGKRAEDALSTLMSVKKKASTLLIDVISSAISNAKRVPGAETADLYISSLVANGGPQMKRFRAASMGRASTIRKRTSHITVELDVRAAVASENKAAGFDSTKVKNKATKRSGSNVTKESHNVKKGSEKASTKSEHGKKGKE